MFVYEENCIDIIANKYFTQKYYCLVRLVLSSVDAKCEYEYNILVFAFGMILSS